MRRVVAAAMVAAGVGLSTWVVPVGARAQPYPWEVRQAEDEAKARARARLRRPGATGGEQANSKASAPKLGKVAPAKPVADRAIMQLLVRSGYKELADSLAGSLDSVADRELASLEKSGRPLPTDMQIALKSAHRAAFAADRFLAFVAGHIQGKLEPEDIARANAFLDTPSGKRIIESVVAQGTPVGKLELAAFAGWAQNNAEKLAARAAGYRELDDATGTSKLGANLVLGMIQAMQTGIFGTGHLSVDVKLEQFLAEIETRRPQVLAQMRNQALLTFAFLEEKLGEAVMLDYVAYATSPHGRRMAEISNAALEHAIARCALEFGRGVGQLVKAPRAKPARKPEQKA